MRSKLVEQPELRFIAPRLKLTQEFYAKYDRISRILDDNRAILDLVHADLVAHEGEGDPSRFRYASDVVLRVGVCQLVEGLSLRQVIVRIDTCDALRDFTRIESRAMIDYSTFCRLRNAISLKPGGIASFQVSTYRKNYSFRLDDYLAGGALDQAMEMHVLSQAKIFEILRATGGEQLEVIEDDRAGSSAIEVSNTFLVRRGTGR